MSINSICLELPTKLEEILNFSLNFDGLKKIIVFFQRNNSILVSTLKDFNKRMLAFESLQSDIDDIKIKSLNIEKTNEEINNSFSYIRERILFLDQKFNELSKKEEENIKILDKGKNILVNHEELINKLNLYTDGNYKALKDVKDNYDAIKKKVDTNDIKIKDLEQKNNEAMGLIKSNSRNINQDKLVLSQKIEIMNEDIKNLNTIINNMKKYNDIKNKEYDLKINELLKIVSKANNNPKSYSTNSLEFAFLNNNNNNNNNDNINDNDVSSGNIDTLCVVTKSELEKEKKKISKLFEDEQKLKKDNDLNKKTIKEIQSNLDNINKKLKRIPNENNSFNNLLFEKKDSSNDLDYIVNDKYKILSDNIKLLSVTLNTKPSIEDFESIKRSMDLRLKKLEILQNSSNNNINSSNDLKEKRENLFLTDTKSVEYIIEKVQNTINENLSPIIRDYILKFGKNIDLSNNLVITNLIKNNKKYFEEINKKFITEIDSKYKLIKDLEAKIEQTNDEVLKLYNSNNRHKDKIAYLINTIEGPEKENNVDEEENNDKLNNGTIKEKLSSLINLYYEVRDRVVLFEKKYNSLNKEVKEEIKLNLKNETMKIVGQFKNKLSSFTYKFEEELKKKIDQISLYSFEKRINSLVLTELKEKLNKNELKKSNSIMNRKIDFLENKISKTLVDAIIDIQMDEAPLIVKNNNNMEICASCNQLLKKNNSSIDNSLSPSKTHNKFKIKNAKYCGNYTQTLNIKNNLSSPKKYLPEININNSKEK